MRSATLVESLSRIVRTGELNKGAWVTRFEEEIARYSGTADAVLVSSGSAAITLLVRALRPPEKVILPAFLFPPVAGAVVDGGGEIGFADVSADTWMAGRAEFDAATSGTYSLVLGFHLFGRPCDAPGIEQFAARGGAHAIFDAAHAYGASIEGRRCGSFGLAEAFSLTPSKLVTGGEGGVVTTGDTGLARELRSLRDYGKDDGGAFARRGVSARPTESAACIASHSLGEVGEELARRSELCALYESQLGGLQGVGLPVDGGGTEPSGHEFAIRIDPTLFGMDRDRLALLMSAEGVEVRCQYKQPAHSVPWLQRTTGDRKFPVSEALSRTLLQLPLSTDVTPTVAEQVGELIGDIQRHSTRLLVAGGSGT